MRKLGLSFIIVICFLSCIALPPAKDDFTKALKKYYEFKTWESKSQQEKDNEPDRYLILGKNAAYALFLADTNLTQKEKLVAQTYALISCLAVEDILFKRKDNIEIVKFSNGIKKYVWKENEKLPNSVRWDSLKMKIYVTKEDFIKYRASHFDNVIKASREAGRWSSLEEHSTIYSGLIPDPEKRADIQLYNKKLYLLYNKAYAAAMLQSAPQSRENGFLFFDFINKKRNIIDDRVKTLVFAKSLDSFYHSNSFNYTDFDNNIKVRTVAAKAFEKLEAPAIAFRIYHEAINSGSKSLGMLIGRLNAATALQDPAKINESLQAFEDKNQSIANKRTGKLVKDCRQMLANGM